MKDRISCYSENAEEIHDILLYEENITDHEKANALIALFAMVNSLKFEIEALKEKLEEENDNPYRLKGIDLENAFNKRRHQWHRRYDS